MNFKLTFYSGFIIEDFVCAYNVLWSNPFSSTLTNFSPVQPPLSPLSFMWSETPRKIESV